MTERELKRIRNVEKKELIAHKPFSTITAWITQRRETALSFKNAVWTNEIGAISENWAEKDRQITDSDIHQAILGIIVKNLRGKLWSVYFKNKELDIPNYINPSLNVFEDVQLYISKHHPILRTDDYSEFTQILKNFGVSYEIGERSLNSQSLPVVKFKVEFDLKKANSFINNSIKQ